MANVLIRKGKIVQDPSLLRMLLSNLQAGWMWVLPRIWLGWQRFQIARHKIDTPWHDTARPVKAEPDMPTATAEALMAWADDGGAGESGAQK